MCCELGATRFDAEQAVHTIGAPLAYLTRLRMIRAIRLLEDRSLSVADISRRVGYTSEFAFSRAFKRVHGKPPTAMRSVRIKAASSDPA